MFKRQQVGHAGPWQGKRSGRNVNTSSSCCNGLQLQLCPQKWYDCLDDIKNKYSKCLPLPALHAVQCMKGTVCRKEMMKVDMQDPWLDSRNGAVGGQHHNSCVILIIFLLFLLRLAA